MGKPAIKQNTKNYHRLYYHMRHTGLHLAVFFHKLSLRTLNIDSDKSLKIQNIFVNASGFCILIYCTFTHHYVMYTVLIQQVTVYWQGGPHYLVLHIAAATVSWGTIEWDGIKYFCEDFSVISTGSMNLASYWSNTLGKGFNINGFIGKLILLTKPLISPGIGW